MGPLSKFADPKADGSLAYRSRQRRWAELTSRFAGFASMRVLDLGGRPESWRLSPVKPASVVTVNLEERTSDDPTITHVQGDACRLPDSLAREQFDLVYSNSVIEHVGGYAKRVEFAETVHTTATHYWVQTPYRYFPVEPHWWFPGLQFLPLASRSVVAGHWRWGKKVSTPASAVADVSRVELLTVTEMRHLFPGSEIWHERVAGLTKSLVATR